MEVRRVQRYVAVDQLLHLLPASYADRRHHLRYRLPEVPHRVKRALDGAEGVGEDPVGVPRKGRREAEIHRGVPRRLLPPPHPLRSLQGLPFSDGGLHLLTLLRPLRAASRGPVGGVYLGAMGVSTLSGSCNLDPLTTGAEVSSWR